MFILQKKHCLPSCDDRTLRKLYYDMILKAVPLDDIRDEIADRADADAYGDYQQGISLGLIGALQIIDKYTEESEG